MNPIFEVFWNGVISGWAVGCATTALIAWACGCFKETKA
jgi:hypothetical protein